MTKFEKTRLASDLESLVEGRMRRIPFDPTSCNDTRYCSVVAQDLCGILAQRLRELALGGVRVKVGVNLREQNDGVGVNVNLDVCP